MGNKLIVSKIDYTSRFLAALQCIDWAKLEKKVGSARAVKYKAKVETVISYFYNFTYQMPSKVEKLYLIATQKEVVSKYKEHFGDTSPVDVICNLFKEVFRKRNNPEKNK